MKRAAFFAFGASLCFVFQHSYAGPSVGAGPAKAPPKAPANGKGGPSAAPGTARAQVNAVPRFYKPSYNGTDTTPAASKEAASVGCMYQGHPVNAYSMRVWSGGAYCERKDSFVDARDVMCDPGQTLVVENSIPKKIRGSFANADQCLKNGAPPESKDSYVQAKCSVGLIASNYALTVNEGPDKCAKTISLLFVHMPGSMNPDGVKGAPSQVQINERTLNCPENATLKQEGNTVYCQGV